MKYLKTEFQKLRRRHLWLLFAAALGFIILWALWAVRDLDLTRLNDTTGMLYQNFMLINSIVTPLVLAVAASRMCDIEQTGRTYSWIFTVESPTAFLQSKLLAGAIHLSVFDLIQSVFFFTLNQAYRPGWKIYYFEYFVSLIAIHLFLFLFQLLLSLRFENQLLPLFVSIGGTFVGLFSWFLGQYPLRYLIPWGYFSSLCNVGLNYDSATRHSTYYWNHYPLQWLLVLLICTGVLYFLGKKYFCRQIAAM
ncbi:MAG: ABC transporter permease [Blautia sp.]